MWLRQIGYLNNFSRIKTPTENGMVNIRECSSNGLEECLYWMFMLYLGLWFIMLQCVSICKFIFSFFLFFFSGFPLEGARMFDRLYLHNILV